MIKRELKEREKESLFLIVRQQRYEVLVAKHVEVHSFH